jgi:crotonobetainyl-CoA:carnitine CoA-transferase CaiB-like acyl-CoA transferase
LFRSIGREDLILDPRFLTNEKRVENVVALDEIIGGFIATMTLSEGLGFFERAEVTVGPIYDAVQLMEDEHVKERGSIVEFPDEDVGSLPMHCVVPRFSGTPGVIRRRAPRLNEHANEIRADLASRRLQTQAGE